MIAEVTKLNGVLPLKSFKRRCEVRDRLQEGATDQDFDDALTGVRNDSWARKNDYFGDPVRHALKEENFERYRNYGRRLHEEEEQEGKRKATEKREWLQAKERCDAGEHEWQDGWCKWCCADRPRTDAESQEPEGEVLLRRWRENHPSLTTEVEGR